MIIRRWPEVLNEELIRGRRSLVVAGTHGKTTTTSIDGLGIMEQAGLNPSFLVRRCCRELRVILSSDRQSYFVIEGDEYDTAYFDKGPKFMHYLPDTGILNNIEFDHADIIAHCRGSSLHSAA